MTTDLQAVDLPFDEAIAFFRQKANVKTQRWTDVWREAHSRSFMVAGAATDALVEDFRQAVDKAVSQGTTLAEFRKDFDAIVQKHGWVHTGGPGWRSRVIYETNLAGAYSAGRYAQMSDPDVIKAYPYWEYCHGDSRRPRPLHLSWNGMVLRCDDPFWSSHYPPNGWRCSCYVRPVSGARLGRLGKSGPDQAPEIKYNTWVDKKTGTAHQVPEGIDPGFDYNPGKAWLNAPVRSPPMREVKGDDAAARLIEAKPLPAMPAQLAAFLEKPEGDIEVASLPHAARAALQTQADAVQLSAETLAKQRKTHQRDVTDADYAALTEVIADPSVILKQDRNHVIMLARRGGLAFAVTVKATEARDKNFVVSFYKPRLKSVGQLLRAHDLVVGSLDDLKDE